MTYYNSGNIISTESFMEFRGPIGPSEPYPDEQTAATGPVSALIGVGFGHRGYGQTWQFLPAVNTAQTVSHVEWNALRETMSNINIHTGSDLTVQPKVDTYNQIIAEDGDSFVSVLNCSISTGNAYAYTLTPIEFVRAGMNVVGTGIDVGTVVIGSSTGLNGAPNAIELSKAALSDSQGNITISGNVANVEALCNTLDLNRMLFADTQMVTNVALTSTRNTPWNTMGSDTVVIQRNPVCIAVINETSVSAATIQADYERFRTKFPNHYIYLLQPTKGGYSPSALRIPNGWSAAKGDFGAISVPTDNGDISKRADWYTLCKLSDLPSGSKIGIYLDESGSLDASSSVKASYNYLLENLTRNGITWETKKDTQENWIAPFINMSLSAGPTTVDTSGNTKIYTVTHEFTVDFKSEDKARWYFNSGGAINISASHTGGTNGNVVVYNPPFISANVYPVTWGTWSTFMQDHAVWVDPVVVGNPVCIAVIDECSVSASTIQNDYNTFRARFPNYYIYVLQPDDNDDLNIPPNWSAAKGDFGPIAVPKDNGNVNQRADWFAICNLDQLPGGSKVGIFIDSSGSMDGPESVQASYNYLLQRLQNKGITWQTVVNSNENWISPFLGMSLSAGSSTPDKSGSLQIYYRNFTAPNNGTYRFRFQADNRLTLYIDDVKVGTTTNFTSDPTTVYMDLQSGNHVLRFEAYNDPLSGGTRVWTENPAGWAVVIDQHYWDTRTYALGEVVPGSPSITSPTVYPVQFNTWSPFMNRYAVWVNAGINPLNGISQNIYRNFTAPSTGTYTISIAADDRLRLYLDNNLVANVYRNFGTSVFTVNVNMSAGSHVLRFEGLNDGGASTWTSNPAGWAVTISSPVLWDSRDHLNAETVTTATAFTTPQLYPVSSTAGDWNSFMNSNAVWPNPVAESLVKVPITSYRLISISQSGNYLFTYAVDDSMVIYIDSAEVIRADVTTSRYNKSPGTKTLYLSAGTHILRVDAYNDPIRGGWAITVHNSSGVKVWDTRGHMAPETIPGPNGSNSVVITDNTANGAMSNVLVRGGTVIVSADTVTTTGIDGKAYPLGYYQLTGDYKTIYLAPNPETNQAPQISVKDRSWSSPNINYQYKVPLDASVLTFKLWGAGGAGGYRYNDGNVQPGGAGAYVQATIPVTGGETLSIKVGGGGQPGLMPKNNNEWEDIFGGGGGGWTGVFRGNNPLIIAAGGGGSPVNGPISTAGQVIWSTRSALAAETIQGTAFTSPEVYPVSTSLNNPWSAWMNANAVWTSPEVISNIGSWQIRHRTINIPTTGQYTFTYATDDQLKIYIDDTYQIFSEDTFSSSTGPKTKNINLTAGVHVMRFECYNDPKHGGWGLIVTNSLNAVIWKTRDHMPAERIPSMPFTSPQVYPISSEPTGGWNQWMKSYAVWPVAGNVQPATTTFTMYRNFEAPYTGTYLVSASADNRMEFYIDELKVLTTDDTYKNGPTTLSINIQAGPHVLKFVATNRDNPSPAGYAVTISVPRRGGKGGAGGITTGSPGLLGNGNVNSGGGTQTSGGAGGIGDFPKYNGANGGYLRGGYGGNDDIINNGTAWSMHESYHNGLTVYPGINGGVNGGAMGGEYGAGGGGGGFYGGGGGGGGGNTPSTTTVRFTVTKSSSDINTITFNGPDVFTFTGSQTGNFTQNIYYNTDYALSTTGSGSGGQVLQIQAGGTRIGLDDRQPGGDNDYNDITVTASTGTFFQNGSTFYYRLAGGDSTPTAIYGPGGGGGGSSYIGQMAGNVVTAISPDGFSAPNRSDPDYVPGAGAGGQEGLTKGDYGKKGGDGLAVVYITNTIVASSACTWTVQARRENYQGVRDANGSLIRIRSTMTSNAIVGTGSTTFSPVAISVINECSQSSATMQDSYNRFRLTYPNAKLYLLQPGNGYDPSDLRIPSNWSTSNGDYGPIKVNEDNGNVGQASDWYSICNLDQLPSGSKIGIFLDNSGSLGTEKVSASYNLLLQKIATRGITQTTRITSDENWISPFINMSLTVPEGVGTTNAVVNGTTTSTVKRRKAAGVLVIEEPVFATVKGLGDVPPGPTGPTGPSCIPGDMYLAVYGYPVPRWEGTPIRVLTKPGMINITWNSLQDVNNFFGTGNVVGSNSTVNFTNFTWNTSGSSYIDTYTRFTGMSNPPVTEKKVGVVGYVASGNVTDGTYTRTITTPSKANLAIASTLTYHINQGGDNKWGDPPEISHNDQLYLEYSKDGSRWLELDKVMPGAISYNVWTPRNINLPSDAKVTSGVFLRYRQSGWNNGDRQYRDNWAMTGVYLTNTPTSVIPEGWCIRYLAYLEFPTTGTWTLTYEHSHGGWFWFDQRLVMQDDRPSNAVITQTYSASVQAGRKYPIQLDQELESIYNFKYPFVCKLYWKGPGVTANTLIPVSAFCYDPANPPPKLNNPDARES